MSDRYKGAILSPTAPTVTPQSAGGIYTSSQQLQYQGQGVWPTAFNNPINNSLRFRASASAYLDRTPASVGNRKTFTFSTWIKLGEIAAGNGTIFSAGTSSGESTRFYLRYTGSQFQTGYGSNNLDTTVAVYRDPSAWYHLVLAVDTTQATAANRLKIYVNGVQQAVTTSVNFTQNVDTAVNNTVVHNICREAAISTGYVDGYLAEVNFIDGSALTPSSFGTTDAYGIWQPIPYTGAYGTNGFYLPFRLNSTSSYYGGFNGSSQYLSTTSGITNQFTPTSGFTLEMWLNPSNTNTAQVFYVGGGSNSWSATNGYLFGLLLGSGGNYQWQWNNAGATYTLSFPDLPTNQWSHVAIGYNGTTTRIWVNGVSAGTSTNPYTVPTTVNQYAIGSNFGGAANFYTGQLSNLRFVKGTDVYGVANANISVPISPLTAITNTQLLTLQNATIIDNSTNAFSITNTGSVTTTATTDIFALPTLTSDYSGNNNNWAANNISLTPGSTYDSMKDVPTNTNSNTANYCTLNPLDKATSFNPTGGNLNFAPANTSDLYSCRSTIQIPSTGKWIWEVTNTNSAYMITAGLLNGSTATTGQQTVSCASMTVGSIGTFFSTTQWMNTTTSWSVTNIGNGDTLVIAYDADGGYIWFGRVASGGTTVTWYNTSGTADPSTGTDPRASGITAGGWFAGFGTYFTPSGASANFGQRPFAFTNIPTGFYPLNTYNLPTPTILDGDQYMDISLYSGTGAIQSITGLNFQPDFVWIKNRNNTAGHSWFDAVRGVSSSSAPFLQSQSTTTEADFNGTVGDRTLTSLNSNGFTLGADGLGLTVNGSSRTYVAWQWRASNAAGVSNTQGTITSTVSANTTAGFSIVTGTLGAAGVQSTVGHGLGVAPNMIIFKTRSGATYNWAIYHSSVCDTTSKYFRFTTDALQTYSTTWGASLPTSTLFGVTGDGCGSPSNPFVAYCFSAVAGYSAFGSYTGNGSSDGPFVFAGFRPRFVLLKASNAATDWYIYDTARDTYNVATLELNPNLAAAEQNGTYGSMDINSNGFKLRFATGEVNASGTTYIYACFAENPFKISRAR